jgi:hypothetical protein
VSSYVIIPDVHEQHERLRRILSDMKGAGRILFLGDMLDSFVPGQTASMLALLTEILETDALFCLGNHDAHYLYGSRHLLCSGYSLRKRELIRQHPDLVREWKRRAQVYHELDGWVASHAGFHPTVIKEVEESYGLRIECGMALDQADRMGGNHTLLQAGFRRGGFHPVGGPLWLDWRDFEPVENFNQIVGHTNQPPEVRWNGQNVCLDTNLGHVALVTGPEHTDLEVVAVP